MKSCFAGIAGALLAIASMAVAPIIRVRAQADPNAVEFQPFTFNGYQPDSSSPLLLQGDPIGKNAIWHLQVGHILSDQILTIPAAPAPAQFGGAACQADFSQAEIVTEDTESSLTLDVYGFRCAPNGPAAGANTADFQIGTAFTKHASYNIVGATGMFSGFSGGLGTLTMSGLSDGSVRFSSQGTLLVTNSRMMNHPGTRK